MKRYSAKGFVYGNNWGGGHCGYPSRFLCASSFKEIKEQAIKGVEDGSLNSGMGLESLIGAVLQLIICDVKIINKKEYTHTTKRFLIVGKVSKKLIAFYKKALVN